jgi:hypothetical protein
MGATLLGLLRKFLIVGRRVGFTYQDIFGESPDSIETSLGVAETEGFGKLGIGLASMSAK